jgi:hypothetical protein
MLWWNADFLAELHQLGLGEALAYLSVSALQLGRSLQYPFEGWSIDATFCRN